MVPEANIDEIMKRHGYGVTYDNGRQKIWENANPAPGAKRKITVPFPCSEADLNRLLDKAGLSL